MNKAVTFGTMMALLLAAALMFFLSPATPQVTKEVVMTDTAQSLTNKTYVSPIFSGTATGSLTGLSLTTPTFTGSIGGTYTLGGTPTLTAPIFSGSITGTYTLAGTPTITAPTISSPVFSGSVTGTYTLGGTPTITAPTITGTAAMAAASLTGALSSTRACTTGYTRASPNYCVKNDVTGTTWTDAIACTSRVIGSAGLGVNTKVVLRVVWQALSNNATGSRTNDVTLFSNTGCTTPRSTSNYTIREFASVSAGTVIGQTESLLVAEILNAADTVYATQTNAGGNGNADLLNATIVGYFD